MKHKKRKKNTKKLILLISGLVTLLALATVGGFFLVMRATEPQGPTAEERAEELLGQYMAHLEAGEYEDMYAMTTASAASLPTDSDTATNPNVTPTDGGELSSDAAPNGGNGLTKESFIERNSKIYEGIELSNLQYDTVGSIEYADGSVAVTYQMSFGTVAGDVSFENLMEFEPVGDGYKIKWRDALIFPNLESSDRVSVTATQPIRGEITDRNGHLLAGKGTISTLGIVPGKLENREEAISEIATLLSISTDSIENKLSANWVKDDLFVPIATLPNLRATEIANPEQEAQMAEEQRRRDQLLEIPGVALTNTEARYYPLGKAAAHLVGYVQNVTAEDLEEHPDEGYTSDSVIGKSGMEALFEEELRGQNGFSIRIVTESGETKETIAFRAPENGKNIQLTIDSELQKSLYAQFQDEPGCSVAMNPRTGEVLALVSTPSYDSNDFITGFSQAAWDALNADEAKPMFNRFRQIWCPGSTIKPIIAAIGLDAGAFSAEEDFGSSGLSWQKDESWGSYYVTTLHSYEPAILKNALIYSDNIYFAKAALRIGADHLQAALDALGFNQQPPFDILMTPSQYSNSETITAEVQLADSGYGQGEMLVNPLHLACIYTAFFNGGTIIKPYLQYQETPLQEAWLANAFSAESSSTVKDALIDVVNTPEGTGYAAHRDDITLAGKTGTAEIKSGKQDEDGTEIGWFSVFTADESTESPVLIVSMVENVKESGGSGYVVGKVKDVLDRYIGQSR